MNDSVQSQVSGPATGLMVAGGLGILGHILTLLIHFGLMGLNLAAFNRGPAAAMMGGGIGIVISVIALVVNLIVVFGAMKMKALQNHGLAMAAAILALVGCFSPCPCCFLSLGMGIWALIVLLKPEVKAAFTA